MGRRAEGQVAKVTSQREPEYPFLHLAKDPHLMSLSPFFPERLKKIAPNQSHWPPPPPMFFPLQEGGRLNSFFKPASQDSSWDQGCWECIHPETRWRRGTVSCKLLPPPPAYPHHQAPAHPIVYPVPAPSLSGAHRETQRSGVRTI